MNILRVFPYRTSYTPMDCMVWIGTPFKQIVFDNDCIIEDIPRHDEVHISCVFSWDKELCLKLQDEWRQATSAPVRIGGPAFGSPAKDFNKGLYMREDIIFTSRGCNNNCPWCCVPKLEGALKELPVCRGRIIQDNNFLQADKAHQAKVFDMLKTQNGICFKGGLQADLVTDAFADALNGLYYTFRNGKKVSRISELWLACDTDAALPRFKRAVEILAKRGFTRNKIHCYALIGDDMDKNEARCREIYEAGAMPFAQLYQPVNADKKQEYSGGWKRFARMWSRAPATRAHMEKGTDFRSFNN